MNGVTEWENATKWRKNIPFLQLYQISKGWREQCNAFTGAIFTTDGAMNGL